MVIPLGNYYRCRSGVRSQVVTRSTARKMAAEMQTPEPARSEETFVEVTPVLDFPEPLLDPSTLSVVSLDDTTTAADVDGDFGGDGKVCPETIQRCRVQAVDFEYKYMLVVPLIRMKWNIFQGRTHRDEFLQQWKMLTL